MPSSPVPAASPHFSDNPPGDALAEDPPVRAAEPADMLMDIDAPSPPHAVDVHPKSQPDGDSSNAVPVPGIGPEALAVPTPYFVDDVAIGESTSLERTNPVKRAATPPCSGEAVRSTGVDRSDNQPNEKAKQKMLDSPREQHQMVASLELEHEAQQVEGSEAANATVDLDDSSALPVQSAGVDPSDAQAGSSSVNLFSRVDHEDDPGEL